MVEIAAEIHDYIKLKLKFQWQVSIDEYAVREVLVNQEDNYRTFQKSNKN